MKQLTVFYNGACPVCSREINAYRRLADRHDGLGFEWIDITRQPDAVRRQSLSDDQAARRLHARPEGGALYSGVEAFALVWERLPGFGWLSRLARLPVSRHAAYILYEWLLAPLMFWLHKRRQQGDSG